MSLLISNAIIVNEGKSFCGSLVIENGFITDIIDEKTITQRHFEEVVDASGCFVLPGLIDDHVHFREPGLTNKADIESESRAAAFGGVTSFFDMPNTVPQTTSLETLNEKFALGKEKSHVNYSFFFGATNDNVELFSQLDPHRIPGIKLFMGSSTGNMLVDREESLNRIFSTATLPIMVHCEDTATINRNMADAKTKYGDDPEIIHHPEIRSEEACYASTALAVQLAKKYGARLHVAHLTTACELSLFESWKDSMPIITAEAVIAHLYFSDKDYTTLGTKIKCNPAVKTEHDRDELRKALTDGRISVVGTDHAPHLLSEKQGGCANAASGMPMVQFSLVTMLELTDKGVLSIERLVQLMCHNPALLFEVNQRGFIRKGYKADIVIVKPNSPWTVTEDIIQSKCKWSPLLGHTFNWKVIHTFCNSIHILNNGVFDNSCLGEEIKFR
ncbi:MAG: dihydroorotase [Prevotella sp.]|nr:dihydroorotase [Prevotella sp.]